LTGVVRDRVSAYRREPPSSVEEAHLEREHVRASQRLVRLVEDVPRDERSTRENEVRVVERLPVRELDWTSWLARTGLAERHAEIPGPVRVERAASGRQLPDFEAAEAIRARGAALGDRLARQPELHPPQRSPLGAHDPAANDARALLLDRRVARRRSLLGPECLRRLPGLRSAAGLPGREQEKCCAEDGEEHH
jgi:hypothetical protein